MNLVQAQIAHKIRAHFVRQDALMPRNGPVELYNRDQNALVNDLVDIFGYQNASFNEKAFRDIVNDH